MKLLFIFILLLNIAIIPAHSQNKSYWLGAGFALSSPTTTITADLNLQTGKHLYFGILTDVSFSNNQLITYSETTSLGVGAGYLYKRQSLFLTASSGLTLDVLYNSNEYGIGLPLKLQVYFAARRVGVGLNCFYKFNAFKDYGGIGLVFGLGRMR